jgi:DNA polymerase-3 subunit epsilon
MENRDWIVLDTETTGVDPSSDRVIEIGAVRIKNRIVTEEVFHTYLQPDRYVSPGALAVHGITDKFLAGKPRFADISKDFVDWIDGGVLVIHNAPFDVGFLDMELRRVGLGSIQVYTQEVIDTLIMARRMHRGKKNDLNSLLARYQIDNTERSLHGALLDAKLLAQLFMRMTQCQEEILYESLSYDKGLVEVDLKLFEDRLAMIDPSWVE